VVQNKQAAQVVTVEQEATNGGQGVYRHFRRRPVRTTVVERQSTVSLAFNRKCHGRVAVVARSSAVVDPSRVYSDSARRVPLVTTTADAEDREGPRCAIGIVPGELKYLRASREDAPSLRRTPPNSMEQWGQGQSRAGRIVAMAV
jgi:hypothetical protein